MYILISRNNFDGTHRYEYPTLEKAVQMYEATKIVVDLPGGPDTELILYEGSVDSKNILKRHIKKAIK